MKTSAKNIIDEIRIQPKSRLEVKEMQLSNDHLGSVQYLA